MRVAYIAGWGRSGSTLLARLLAVHPEVVFVGELRDLWTRGVLENRRCGCGVVFSDCAWWQQVGEVAFGSWRRADADRAVALRAQVDRPWRVRTLAGAADDASEEVHEYRALLRRVLFAIATVEPGRTVVDSSKIPSFGLALAGLREVDLRVVHLVRDSRGTVHSWGKQVVRDDAPDGRTTSYMIRYSALAASSRYRLYHAQSDRLRASGLAYRLVRYEDLVQDPVEHVDALLRFLGHDPAVVPIDAIGPDRVHLGVSHSVVGNPMRLQTGALPLRTDDAWYVGMPRSRRITVTAVTRPLLRRYAYDLHPGSVR
jgi:hypothetical protein